MATDPIKTARTLLRPVTDADTHTLVAIRTSPSVGEWWHSPDLGWPTQDADAEHASRFAIELIDAPDIGPDGAVVGMVQAYEADDPEYAIAGMDLFLAASVQRRGLGREVVAAITTWLIEVRGQHRVSIDPAVANAGAIACYRACGYQQVGVLHSYERNIDKRGWHDNLLMEYVVAPS
jgi:aminoglycoside 6'-N-acetyltransferase